ncbi:VOC family protein, partial [Klebsiella pneumoniae]|nr:VOC family protein [Klebsiella pneumoniae]
AKSFYDKLLGTLGVPPAIVDRHRIFYRTKTGTFSVSKPIDGKPATPANGGTIGFAAASTAEADAWHAAG